jgi:hypothetical protein
LKMRKESIRKELRIESRKSVLILREGKPNVIQFVGVSKWIELWIRKCNHLHSESSGLLKN